jgi:hypothetical protein
LCRLAASAYGLKAMRITTAQRFHTEDGLHRAMTFVRENAAAGLAVDAWASLLCTPWTTWTYLNESRFGPRYRARLSYQRRLSIRMVGHAERVLAAAASSAGAGHFGLARHCRGWQRRRVRDMIARLSLVSAGCDGCSFGVEVSPGQAAHEVEDRYGQAIDGAESRRPALQWGSCTWHSLWQGCATPMTLSTVDVSLHIGSYDQAWAT